MVGLPARGKTYIAQKLSRYLNWLGVATRVFNVGNYSRRISGAARTHDFFDPKNAAAEDARMQAAHCALADMLSWVKEDYAHEVAIYDATNSTVDRRNMLRKACAAANMAVLLVESICESDNIVRANVCEVKVSCPDYVDVPAEQAIADFYARIEHYQKTYQSIRADDDEADASFVQLINVGERAVINRIQDYRQSRIVFFLMNLHIQPREIYICRVPLLLLLRPVAWRDKAQRCGADWRRRRPERARRRVCRHPADSARGQSRERATDSTRPI